MGSRGTGIKKLVALLAALTTAEIQNQHYIILIDEPETSLHADAQHMLRRVLEKIASGPKAQVIYATHSPSMINTMRPATIRVMRRDRVNEEATSIIENACYDHDYRRVRTSLGITPSDSLLYAPITVIVEGPTEIRCLPRLLEMFENAALPGFEDVQLLLSQAHFLDGEGSSFEYMCRLALSQNASPVIFVDGDKLSEVEMIRGKHPDVPILHLEAGTEFEQIVPEEKYIQAVSISLNDHSQKITIEYFDLWRAEQSKSRAFSKQIRRWIEDISDKPLYKPLIMEKAIEIAGIDLINPDVFRRLVAAMRTAIQ